MVPVALIAIPAAIISSMHETATSAANMGESLSRAARAIESLGDLEYVGPRRHVARREFKRVHGRRTASLQSRSNRRKKHR